MTVPAFYIEGDSKQFLYIAPNDILFHVDEPGASARAPKANSVWMKYYELNEMIFLLLFFFFLS